MSNSLEFEYKYNATAVRKEDFIEFFSKITGRNPVYGGSWDRYYFNSVNGQFRRFRNSDSPELTLKIKHSTQNNFIRTEIDLPLDPERLTVEIVDEYLAYEGYFLNFSIYKECCIFLLDSIIYSFYSVWDENLKFLDSFIEIEVNKEFISQNGEQAAREELQKAENYLSKFGISFKNRLVKSLFELYKR